MRAFGGRLDISSGAVEILRPSRTSIEEEVSLRRINFKLSTLSIGSSLKNFGASPSCQNAGKGVVDSEVMISSMKEYLMAPLREAHDQLGSTTPGTCLVTAWAAGCHRIAV